MKRILFMVLLLAMLPVLQGCHTLYGAAEGFKKDVQGVRDKDHPIYRMDDWMREHLW